MSNIVKAGDTMASLEIAMRAASSLKQARGLLPESLKTEGEIVAVILAGSELGIPPMAALRGLQVVRGKVIISYDTMVGLLQRAGYRVEWLESSKSKATLKLTAPDGAEHVETWDQDRAKTAGLWGKGTWANYPDTMLRARCVSSAARAFAGGVLAGCYTPEEGDEIRRGRAVRAVLADAAIGSEPSDAELLDVEPESPASAEMAAEREALRKRVVTWVRAVGSRAERAASYKQIVSDAEALDVSKDTVDAWAHEAKEHAA